MVQQILDDIIRRGDLAHLILSLWAASSSFLVLWLLKELVASNKRFDDFVRALARLNDIFHQQKDHYYE